VNTDNPKKSKLGLKLVSVILAVLLWIYIGNQGGSSNRQSTLKADLEYLNLGEGLSIKQAPSQVSVKLWGTRKGSEKATAFVDLSGMEEGTHLVPVELEPIAGAMFTRVEPREVEVVLSKLQQREFRIEYQITANPPVGYELLDMVTTSDHCIITGEEDVLSRVSQIICPVDLSTTTEVSSLRFRLQARDTKGNVINRGVTIIPETVVVHAAVSEKLISKALPVKGVLKGKAAEGYQVTQVIIIPDKVNIIANRELPAQIKEINTPEIDITEKKQSFSQEVILQAPAGAKISPSRVLVEVSIEKAPEEESDIEDNS